MLNFIDENVINDIKGYLRKIGTPNIIIENINSSNFESVFIKSITDSNVLDKNKKKTKSNGKENSQTHLDIPGKNYKFFMTKEEKERYENTGESSKKIYIRILENNLKHLENIDTISEIENNENDIIKVREGYNLEDIDEFGYIEATAIAKFGHKANAQCQINTPNGNMNKFRKLIYTNDVILFFKYKNTKDEYLTIAIPGEEINYFKSKELKELNANNIYIMKDNKIFKTYKIKFEGNTISENKFKMSDVAYKIIEHYIENNNVTFEELKDNFENCKIEDEEFISKLDERDDYLKDSKYLEIDGTKFNIYSQWNNKSFEEFTENVAIYGYSIEENKEKVKYAKNKIFIGAPGVGKSKYVDDIYYNDFAKRIIAHPEYTYNDFIGCIKPCMNEYNELEYKFIPGVFTEILKEALKDPYNMYTLIIEEINRANIAAMFGDLFQLLDRNSEGSSEYRINNFEIYKYIKSEIGDIYGYNDGSIGIPSNLNIIATMNTSDQNTFVMDTAFKRRWEFEHIPVEFNKEHKFKNSIIHGLEISWEKFVNTINEFMMSEDNEDLFISEDKQIGQYFIKEDELTDKKRFGYKVLMYLWDDVFKIDKYRIFNNEIRTFSKLMERFLNGNSEEIFNAEFKNKLLGNK